MACLANLCQAVLATGQGRLAAAGVWVLNEKRLTERAGLDAIQDRLTQPWPDLGPLVSDVRACLELRDGVWAAARNLQQAGARAGVARYVVVSIVGIEKSAGGYGSAKLAHEQAVLAGPVPARILTGHVTEDQPRRRLLR